MAASACQRITLVFAFFFFAGLSQAAFSQSPINIEQLLTKPSVWQISSSVDYRGSSLGSFQNGRQLTGSTGLRYGLTPRVEINARLTGWQYRQSVGELQSEEQGHSVSIGGNWLLKRESLLPAMLLEARGELLSRGSPEERSFPGGSVGLTLYKSSDPVVLSLRASMNLRRSYRFESVKVSPGATWSIEPGVNFAVNANVTLFGSAFFERRNASLHDGVTLYNAQERVGLRGGLALAVAGRHSLFVSGDLASDQQGGVSLQWFYEF
ncbi:hypothetical protein [Congregibacter litoralis]|uniref:MetA-pathway of phenol degradation n=1 Tax=Congregibacter litoralis KT71 TaxID=314285 RepID=A4ACC9_9GAMM|nr:hypothetical protein [Congregibacter litoralis]EAQ96357.1 hypothetical protein KT71_13260 [Congregibacter litoralis KT71]